MEHRSLRRLLVYALASLLVGLVAGAAVAEQVTKSPRPQDWVDPESGVVDFSKVPERVKFSTDLSADGYGWIDSDVLFGAELENGLITIFANESGSEVLGYNDPATGAMLDAGMRPTSGSKAVSPNTTVVGGADDTENLSDTEG